MHVFSLFPFFYKDEHTYIYIFNMKSHFFKLTYAITIQTAIFILWFLLSMFVYFFSLKILNIFL